MPPSFLFIRSYKLLLGLCVAIVVILVDQLSKYFVYRVMLADIEGIVVAPFFNIIKAWNTGISFSMFNNSGSLGVFLLSAASLIIVAFLVNWLRKEKTRYTQIAIGFIIGGAIGNVIDRITLGAVFDFLDAHAFGYHWPTFNVADSFICIGAFMIIFHSFFSKKEISEVKSEVKEV